MPGIPFTAIYPVGPGSGGAPGAPSGNPDYPGMPAGAVPFSNDITIAAAGTYPVWTPSSGRRFVLTNAFISTDAAMRVALVDGADIAGSRIIDGAFGVNGGASPNLVPVPFPARSVGNVLQVVTDGAGNVRVQVRGWEVAG